MAKLGSSTAGIERQVTAGFTRMGTSLRAFDAIGRRTTQMLTAFVSAATVLSTVRFAQNILAGADALGDMAQQTNVTVESLQRLRFVAAQSGSSAEQMDRALNLLNERLGDAATGSKEAQQAFADLGFRWQDLRQAGTEGAFLSIADAISRLPDATDRAAKQAAIFGARARDLNVTLALGSRGIGEMGRQFETLGAVITTDMVKSMAEANDAVQLLTTVISNKFSQAVAAISPKILELATSLTNVLAAATGSEEALRKLSGLEIPLLQFFQTIAKHAGFVVKGFQDIAGAVRNVFGANILEQNIAGVTKQIAELEHQLARFAQHESHPALAGSSTKGMLETQLEQARATLRLLESQRPIVPDLGTGVRLGPELPPTKPPGLVTAGSPFKIQEAKKLVEDWAAAIERANDAIRAAVLEGQESLIAFGENLTEQFQTPLETLTAFEEKLRETIPLMGESFGPIAEKALKAARKEFEEATASAEDWSAAIKRAMDAIREATEPAQDALREFGASLTEQFQTPIERLTAFQEKLQETLDLLGESFRPTAVQALRAAQIEFARTTVIGAGLEVIAQGITETFDAMFRGIAQGTLSVSEAFKNMASSILASLGKILIQRGIEALLNIALAGIGAGAGAGAGGTGAAIGGGAALGRQRGGLIPGTGTVDSRLSWLTPGEFVMRREAVNVLGLRTLERLNSLAGYQQGGPVLPAPMYAGGQGGMTPALHVHNIIVRSDAEAQQKALDYQQLEGSVVNIVTRQLLGGDGTVINRSLRMVHGSR